MSMLFDFLANHTDGFAASLHCCREGFRIHTFGEPRYNNNSCLGKLSSESSRTRGSLAGDFSGLHDCNAWHSDKRQVDLLTCPHFPRRESYDTCLVIRFADSTEP